MRYCCSLITCWHTSCCRTKQNLQPDDVGLQFKSLETCFKELQMRKYSYRKQWNMKMISCGFHCVSVWMISVTNAKVIFIFLFVYKRLIGALRLCDRTELLVSTCWTGLKVLAFGARWTHLIPAPAWTTCWCSASCGWRPSGTEPSYGPGPRRSNRPASERRAADETRTLRHGDATVTMDT